MITGEWQRGEAAVIGLGRSGTAAAMLLRHHGLAVYASDAGTGETAERNATLVRAAGAEAQTGGHDLDRIARAGVVIVSPGVPGDAAPLARARAAGVAIVSEMDLALSTMPDLRYVAITGTNGKTTTTALVAHLLRALGYDAVAAGNIGTPLSDVALRSARPEWVALEVSSFQLHDTPAINPTVGVVTNLSPDHLDRYPDVDAYYADKALLFQNANARSRWVLNGDEQEVLDLYRRLPAELAPADGELAGDCYRFMLKAAGGAGCYDSGNEMLHAMGTPLLPRGEFALLGDHNVANALAAAVAVLVADPAHAEPAARERIAQGLRSFAGLPHRLEVVGEVDGVQWINDSKATNVSSTRVALLGMTRPTVVLLGGRHKGEPYTSLLDPLRAVARLVIAYGESAPTIERDLASGVKLERMPAGMTFEQVLDRAREAAQPGDAVLLSPACSSYDMFANYEERGAVFRQIATGVAPDA
ncbi:MAG TPA: UDP-N-acetylmuramoyl-L-alanine--D-glutamate ligase [Gemmatimonadaceae bacterium]|nr:UDP-N-acetylmuramoyl-L-alanine--D-glutamate ligase [Gemmatimonadaceae bacterium]